MRAGVSVPTVYRYFPTKEKLLDASARAIDARTNEWLGDDAPVPGEKLREFIHRSWRELAEHLPAVRASHLPGLGHELRQRRSESRRQKAIGAASGGGVDPEDEVGERLVRLLQAIASSSMLLEQLDRLGMTVDDAADDVVWAMEAMIEAARRDQDASP